MAKTAVSFSIPITSKQRITAEKLSTMYLSLSAANTGDSNTWDLILFRTY